MEVVLDHTVVPSNPNQLPAHITLQDLQTCAQVKCKLSQSVSPDFNPFSTFVSGPLTRQTATIRSGLYPKTYKLTITDPDEIPLEQQFIDEYIDQG